MRNSVVVKYVQKINFVRGNYQGCTIHLKKAVCLNFAYGRIQCRMKQLRLNWSGQAPERHAVSLEGIVHTIRQKYN